MSVGLIGGLIAGGVGAASEVLRGIKTCQSALETESSDHSQTTSGSFLSQGHQVIRDCDSNRFQKMISSQKTAAADARGSHPTR